jgi:hypothetical protein
MRGVGESVALVLMDHDNTPLPLHVVALLDAHPRTVRVVSAYRRLAHAHGTGKGKEEVDDENMN